MVKRYCEEFDAYYDDEKDIWLEHKCGMDDGYCNCHLRPDKPSMVKCKECGKNL